MSENIRIRYGRVNERNPKNTLATFQDGETVFFGISRCNTTVGDRFVKIRGREIASNRAMFAAEEDVSFPTIDGTTIQIHESGMRGQVPSKDVAELLNVFNNIDNVLRNRYVNRTNHTEYLEV